MKRATFPSTESGLKLNTHTHSHIHTLTQTCTEMSEYTSLYTVCRHQMCYTNSLSLDILFSLNPLFKQIPISDRIAAVFYTEDVEGNSVAPQGTRTRSLPVSEAIDQNTQLTNETVY